MNEPMRVIGKPWKPGESGNPAGRPVGSRQKIAEAIIRDISDAWQKHGVVTLEKLARSEPAKFAQLAAGLIPREFQLSVEARLPGGLEPDDWQAMLELLGAVRTALPGDDRKPGEIAELVTDALRLYSAKQVEQ